MSTIDFSTKLVTRLSMEKGEFRFLAKRELVIALFWGMVKFNENIINLRDRVTLLQHEIASNVYYSNVPSVLKRVNKNGFYFHAKNDLPEIRKSFFDLIKTVDCTFQAVVGRKIIKLYERKHNGKSSEFYADMLSHLIKDKFNKDPKLLLNIASRENSTSYQNLQSSLKKTISRFARKNPEKEIRTKVYFNVQPFIEEPLLSIADYFCWSIQRIFERGESRFYNYLQDKISLVVDLYDADNYEKGRNYYTPKNPLSSKNKIGPQSP